MNVLELAWMALDGRALIGLTIVAGLIVFALTTIWLPPAIRHGILYGALALGILCLGLQLGHQRGAHEAHSKALADAAAAEATRAQLAEATRDAIAVQAARDSAQHLSDLERLKELNDALAKDRDAARMCLDNDTARRLRNL